MRFTRKGALATAAMVISLLCTAGTASAASSPFGCRAAVTRVGLPNSTVLEPIVANNQAVPCAGDQEGLSSLSVPSAGTPVLTAGPVDTSTAATSAPSAGALASVDGVTIPTSSGSIVVAGPVYAYATYGCSNGTPVASGTSNLDLLYINGQPVTITPNQNQTLDLGGGSYVSVNERIQTATSLTERVLDVHLQGVADIVVGEAMVAEASSNPCAGSGGGR